MGLTLMNLLSIFQIYSLIGPSFSSISLTFFKKPLHITEEYIRLKSSSVHRGVFLSLSNVQIHEMCQDFFSFQLYANPVEDTNTDGSEIPKYNLLVQEITVKDEQSFQDWGLVVMCTPKLLKNRVPASKHHYLTTAFRSKWLYRTKIPNHDPTRNDQVLWNFITLAPDYSYLKGAELEQWYLNTLQMIEALRTESPEYIHQIENRDNLSRLSEKERLILCASILSSPVYKQDNLEFSLQWIIKTYRTPGAVNFEEKTVSFKSAGNTEVMMKTECFLCKGFDNGKDISSKSTNLYVTRTYEDGYSAMVLKQQIDGTIFPDKYFKNIALLITAQKKIYYHKLRLNFKMRR